MKAGIHQAYYLPYIGYWQLIKSVDLFAVADNYNFIRHGWVNRNRILCNNTIQYCNIEVANISQNRFISEHSLLPINKKKKLKQFSINYVKAPYLQEGLSIMDDILSFEGDNLGDFLYRSICIICDYLRIDTKIVKSSDYEQDPSLKFADRVYDYCRQMGADEYHNLIGGMELYSFDEFKEHGIDLSFVQPVPYEYPQNSKEFVFGLSIMDIIMNNSVDDIQKILDSYNLISKPISSNN